MDIHNDTSMAIEQIRAEITGKKVVAGAKQLRKALASNSVYRVYLAKNADPAITEPIAAICIENHINFAWVRSMSELGSACGIEVGTAAAAAIA